MNKLHYLLKYIPKYLRYCRQRPHGSGSSGPVHIVFCVADHYEPGTGGVDKRVETGRVDALLNTYPKLANAHRDSAGNVAKRTWFFPPHYHRYGSLKKLAGLCREGYGEIELHLHHGKTGPDTSENLEATIDLAVKEYSRLGIFGSENGRKRYGFIHGDWALDNSRGGKYCGVNNEIDLLLKTGCFADFTFPSLRESDPDMINSLYYATDDPLLPKSYNNGIAVSKNGADRKGLMIIEGPLLPVVNLKDAFDLGITGGSIDTRRSGGSILRHLVDVWVGAGIHVKGRPDIVFVKTHMHGAAGDVLELNRRMDLIYDHLESKYNDGSRYALHYVTARQMYNIVKAVEDGSADTGSIEKFRDHKVSAPLYDTSPGVENASEELRKYINMTYR